MWHKINLQLVIYKHHIYIMYMQQCILSRHYATRADAVLDSLYVGENIVYAVIGVIQIVSGVI